MRIRRPSPALAVACLALVVAMSGTAVAATAALKSGDTLIAKRSLSGNRLRYNTVTGHEISEATLGTVPRATKAYSLPPLVWHNLTLTNGWENYYSASARPASWAVDAQGIVHLRGAIDRQSGTSSVFADTPSAIAPPVPIYLASDALNGNIGRVVIGSDWGMQVQDPGSGTNVADFTSLDGITYSRV